MLVQGGHQHGASKTIFRPGTTGLLLTITTLQHVQRFQLNGIKGTDWNLK